MDLIIRNRIIRTPIKQILTKLRSDCDNYYLSYIGDQKGSDLKITCPFHKNGQESHPSCHVYCDYSNDKIYYGTVHCFTCGKQLPLYSMIGYCLNLDDEGGKEWLVENFGDTFVDEDLFLDEIKFDVPTSKARYLDISVLNQYNYYHPYMAQRKLSPEVIQTFKIGYDPETDSLTFPVWDISNNLVFITKRNVRTKFFMIPSDVEKPVYLLNFAINKNYPFLVICESQINALTCYSYGIPAVALFGTGTPFQYELLKKSGITNFVLAFDGDDAGRKGTQRFLKNFKDNYLITILDIPENKDINDLSREEVENLFNKNELYFRIDRLYEY